MASGQDVVYQQNAIAPNRVGVLDEKTITNIRGAGDLVESVLWNRRSYAAKRRGRVRQTHVARYSDRQKIRLIKSSFL